MTSRRLTVATCERATLPAGKASLILWDSQTPGLGLRVGKRGKVWMLKLSVDGKKVTKSLGEYPGLSLAEARDAVSQARLRRSKGEEVVAGPEPLGDWRFEF